MRIVTVRRISQLFFLLFFFWFSIVCAFGTNWWQLRGWPVNLMLQLDPLVALGTLLSTHTIYKGLVWGVLTIILTLIFGRFFCGWVCPFGSLHQFIGYLGNRKRKFKEKIASNRYRKAAVLKYFFLIAFLVGAAIPLGEKTQLLTGLLDPIPFLHRSINIILLPIADRFFNLLSVVPRVYEGAYLIGIIFVLVLGLNLIIPRFFCRFICPTGALLGLIGKYSLFRIGKKESPCSNCMRCEKYCEGGCHPAGKIRINECVLCFNCYDDCNDDIITYQVHESKAGEINQPDFTRRGFILSSVSGIVAVQLLPLSTGSAADNKFTLIRPPGTLPESDFLKRCIKCGQCMRICPTNIIVPSGIFNGLENLWTPVLNFTDGTSGCQLTCTACGHVCPTSAIRPITLSEKLGVNQFADQGPVKLGTAFVDRNRCLPWALNTPCIVCEENCPVTPKAIFTNNKFEIVRSGNRQITKINSSDIHVSGPSMQPDGYGTGDYYLAKNQSENQAENQAGNQMRYRIVGNTDKILNIGQAAEILFKGGDEVKIEVLLHQPYIDNKKCIGCGICEHECPVRYPRAVRVSADNESRSTN